MITLDSIQNDHTSGANEIAIRSAAFLKEQSSEAVFIHSTEFIQKMVLLGNHLREAHPTMAPVHHALYAIISPLWELGEKGATVEQLREFVTKAAQGFINKIKSSTYLLAKVGVVLIQNGQQILTYSSSKAVAAILTRAKNEGLSFRVIIPESRPMYEGRRLAHDLSSAGIRSTFIIDGAASTFLEQTDMVLVGADRISEESVINKIGTRGLAIMAHNLQIPVYCACETTKFLSSKHLPFDQNEMPTEEVWPDAPEQVQIRNMYFEEISLGLFAGIVTERGILNEEDVIQIISNEPPHL